MNTQKSSTKSIYISLEFFKKSPKTNAITTGPLLQLTDHQLTSAELENIKSVDPKLTNKKYQAYAKIWAQAQVNQRQLQATLRVYIDGLSSLTQTFHPVKEQKEEQTLAQKIAALGLD